MRTSGKVDTYEFGHELVDSVSIPENKLNLLFAALFLTAIGVWIGGNLLLLDVSVLQRSAQIALPCFAMLLIFYMLSHSLDNVPWSIVLTYGLMWTVVSSRQVWLIPVVYALALMALIYVVRFLRVKRSEWILGLLMTIIATATILGVTRAYTSFDMLNRLHIGNVHQDTLYHASIAAMIKNYGVVSTGLHGLVETPYHVLSHTLLASISVLSGIGVIEVYGVATWVLFAPILIFCIVACSVALDKTNSFSVPLMWCISCVLLVVAPILFSRWVVSDSFFVSESYLISLGLFLVGLPLFFKHHLSLSDLLLMLILGGMISYAKASVGLIFITLWLSRLIFIKGVRAKTEGVALALSAVGVAWIVFGSATASQGSMNILPLHFISTYSFLGSHVFESGRVWLKGGKLPLNTVSLAIVAILSFFIFHFLLSWIILYQTVAKKGVVSAVTIPVFIYSLTAVLAGAAIILIFSIPGGSAYYFSNVAFFVAVPGVVVLMVFWIDRWQISTQLLLVGSIVLVCSLNFKSYYRASTLSPAHSVRERSTFIESLRELRHTTPMHVVLQPSEEALSSNPVTRCTAQPFVFPAVSERSWVDVIRVREDCAFQYYGYSQYGITESQQTVTVQPRFLPGMELLSWPRAATSPQTSEGVLER